MPDPALSMDAGATQPEPYPRAGVRRIGAINWVGVWTLFAKEVQRFVKVGTQTVLAPVVTTLLFLAIFTLAMTGARPAIHGVPFNEFLAPGLIMMAILQNAFANTSSSVMIAKIQGNIVDILMPPLSAGEVTFALVAGGAVRGLVVGAVTGLAALIFVPLGIAHVWGVLYYAVMASVLMSVLGTMGGVWADKFDHMAAVTNFIITPLSFLSGTFYSVERLPEPFRLISSYNPFFFLIDGFRYGMVGRADGRLGTGAAVVFVISAGLWFLTYRMFARGWKLKA